MASARQRRQRSLRRRAHALRLDSRRRRHYSMREELALFGEVALKQHADGTLEHLARDVVDFAEKYMLSAHRVQDWQKRVINDFVRSSG